MFTVGDSCWLTPGEQREAMSRIVDGGLIKWDNRRNLPLSNGGTTDIYVNMRDMRTDPSMIRYLTELYANPVRRLRVDRIVEVPAAVTPLVGNLSTFTGIPMVTVREEAKPGRVVQGKLIGELRRGERVAVIDDVITDGAGKGPALMELRRAGAKIAAIIVAVDRQQGWRKKLAELGFGDIEVWAGFTLHDLRKFLITENIMQRCDPAVETKNPIVVALDGKPWEEILPIVDRLRPAGCILKVNDFMWTGSVNEVITKLSVYGRVLIDPKIHDIGNTAKNDCARLRENPPWGMTIHASGGQEMIRMVINEMAGTPTKIFVVTVPTSIKGQECEAIYNGRSPMDQVGVFAERSYQVGARNFVCSTEEARALRVRYPDVGILVPALRSPEKQVKGEDQNRPGTFAGAQEAGANFFVGGRQFLQAPDPVAEIFRVAIEELGVDL